MTTVALERDNPSLDTLIKMAASGPVIITRGDKPVFVMLPASEEDLQTWRLGENPEFLDVMRRSWERIHAEGSVSIEEARRRLLSES